MSANIYVGTSGWHYKHWLGPFYPEDSGDEEMLPFYATRFPTVEVNNTFYQLPSAETLAEWRELAPDGFTFAVKASRYLTHMKKLSDAKEPLNNFLARIALLEDRLGPILFQLPPQWHFDRERLDSFLQLLSRNHRYAFEFRDPSWFCQEAYDLLHQSGAAFCIHDMTEQPSPKIVTADFVYIRFHGPDGAYQGSYGKQELSGWAGAISTWQSQGRTVCAYFNNDQAGHAPQNARTLQGMVTT